MYVRSGLSFCRMLMMVMMVMTVSIVVVVWEPASCARTCI